MSDIILSTQNGQAVVSSREVAERFGKNHKDVLRAIENLAAQNCATKSMFYETTFENRGKRSTSSGSPSTSTSTRVIQ